MDERQHPDDLPEDHAETDEEAPPDALPASPGLRRVAIVIYIAIMICVIAGLLTSLVWSGIAADRWSFPMPDSWSF